MFFSKNLIFTLILQIVDISEILTISLSRVSLNPPKLKNHFLKFWKYLEWEASWSSKIPFSIKILKVLKISKILFSFQGLPQPSQARENVFKLRGSEGAHLNPEGDPGDFIDPLHFFSFSLFRYLDLYPGDFLDLFSFLISRSRSGWFYGPLAFILFLSF